jgi:two-component system, sensor histidine kinase RpfC
VPAAEALRRLRARLRDRADSEHEQAFTRLVVVPAMFAYMLWAPHPPEEAGRVVLLSAAIFAFGLAAALAVIAHILWRPAPNPARRLASMGVDVGGVAAGMLVGGVTSTVFFPILLWIILGYGFRFGRPYLFAAAGMSIAAFGVVLALSAEWRAMPFVDTALLLSLVILPGYFSVLLTRLTDAIRRAEEASRAKSHFVAAVSHEFRTPLNAVIGMSEIMGTTRLSRDQADMVATIRAAAVGLLGLVDNVLDLAKLEARHFTIDAEAPLDLHRVLGAVRQMLLHAAAAKGLYLRQRIGPDVPHRLRGDGRAVHQILVNLVGNAIKFTERGGIVVEVEAVEREADGGARLRFEVRDTGLGLSPAAQAGIFERFAQADETRRRVIGGTGLGLSIARELVELMGGAIGVVSAQGRGSRFWFELPLAQAGAGEAFEEPARGEVVVLGGRAAATAAVARLDRLGWRGRAVASDEAALQLARAGDPPPRLVLVVAREPPVDVARLADELGRRGGAEPVDIATFGAGLGALPELTLADLPEDADDAAPM